MVKFYRKTVAVSDLWVSSNDKLSDFYASSWQRGESPVPLLLIRIILASVAVGILTWAVIEGATPYWLIFLTNWGLILVTMTTLSGVLVSFIAVCKKPTESEILPWYMAMYWFLFNVSTTMALMITSLYWVLLYDPNPTREDYTPRMFWLDVVTHGFNSCIVVSELLLSRTPVRGAHVYQPLSVGLWYTAFTGIYYAAGGTDGNGNPYIYEVLDWRNPRRSGIIIAGSVAGLLIIYAVLYGAALCRDKLSSSLLRTTSHNLPFTPPDQHTSAGMA